MSKEVATQNVYVMRDIREADRCKVGKADRVGTRYRRLREQTARPEALSIYWAAKVRCTCKQTKMWAEEMSLSDWGTCVCGRSARAVDIESAVKRALRTTRLHSEWYRVPASYAVCVFRTEAKKAGLRLEELGPAELLAAAQEMPLRLGPEFMRKSKTPPLCKGTVG